MAEPISFGALVGLMVLGTGEPDTVRGEIREIADGKERRSRVARRGPFARTETLDGTVVHVEGPDASWYRTEEGMVMRPHEERRFARYVTSESAIGGLDVGGERPSWSRWDGTDFTRPTGPIAATEFLGRPAYAVELAPPSHKPAPIQLVVDAGTERVLREANAAFGSVTEWVDVEFGADLPDALFRWDGPAIPAATREEQDAEHDADLAARRAWLAARGVADLPIAAEPELQLNAWDDGSGAFHVSLDATVSGSLVRRPHSSEPWDEADDMGWETSYRWSDERWDWCLAGTFTISGEQLELLKVRLATTT